MSTITGTAGTDILIGGPGDDTISGLGGDDQLQGNEGNDILNGGPGNDILAGGSGIDTLTGGTGSDIFRDTAAGLNGDTITDLFPSDRIQITDLNGATAVFEINGSVLTYHDGMVSGSVTIQNLGAGRLVARAIQGGGVEIRLESIAHNDFSGDGISDVLWRNDDGRITDWLGNQTGGLSDNLNNLLRSVSVDWHVAGTGDFNGDGRADILWRNTDGRVTDWLGNSNGGFSDNLGNLLRNVSTDWHVAGTGDFNADGITDILWRNTDGRVTDWLGTSSGGMADNLNNLLRAAGTDWQVAATGDFNGDGHDDILWRNTDGRVTDWLGTDAGGFSDNLSILLRPVDNQWQVAGVGDFNGDGIADIFWRNADGRVTDWLGTSTGGFSDNFSNLLRPVDTQWQVASIGDYNGDGIDDVLWRNADSRVTDWLGTATGAFSDNLDHLLRSVDTHWHVQPDPAAFI